MSTNNYKLGVDLNKGFKSKFSFESGGEAIDSNDQSEWVWINQHRGFINFELKNSTPDYESTVNRELISFSLDKLTIEVAGEVADQMFQYVQAKEIANDLNLPLLVFCSSAFEYRLSDFGISRNQQHLQTTEYNFNKSGEILLSKFQLRSAVELVDIPNKLYQKFIKPSIHQCPSEMVRGLGVFLPSDFFSNALSLPQISAAISIAVNLEDITHVYIFTDQASVFFEDYETELNYSLIPLSEFREVLSISHNCAALIVDNSPLAWWPAVAGNAKSVIGLKRQDQTSCDHPKDWSLVPTASYDFPWDAGLLHKKKALSHEPTVLIAVPAHNVAWNLSTLINLIISLDYDPQKISLVFLEGDSKDSTHEQLLDFSTKYRDRFRRFEVLKDDLGEQGFSLKRRRSQAFQRVRRSRIAVVRNSLLSRGLRDEEYVLWIDADMIDFPRSLLRQLIAAPADIVTPHCRAHNRKMSFDLNTFTFVQGFSDSEKHLVDQLYQPPAGWPRLYLSDLLAYEFMDVDSVGGTILLVRADLHRQGLVFPVTPVNGYIETEALGLMAKERGFRCLGLPKLDVYHVDPNFHQEK